MFQQINFIVKIMQKAPYCKNSFSVKLINLLEKFKIKSFLIDETIKNEDLENKIINHQSLIVNITSIVYRN